MGIGRRWRVLVLATTLVASLGIGTVVGPFTHAGAATEVVKMKDNVFAPKKLVIEVGDKVKWKNVGDNPHTTTRSGKGGWDSGVLDPGQTYARKFKKAGKYSYVCTIHESQGMVGKIIVR